MLLNGIEHTTNHVLVIKSQSQLNQLGEAALLADPDYNNSDLSHRLGNVTVEISFSVGKGTPIRTDASAAVVDAILSEPSGKIPRIKAARLEKDMKLKEAKELVEFIELVEDLVIRKFMRTEGDSWGGSVRVPSPLESCDEPLLD